MAKKWYVIHTQTGHENQVRNSLKKRAQLNGLSENISQILIPTEQVSEVKSGKKSITQRKFFPGYLMVEMELNDKTWYLVRNTPGITGFVGSGAKPLPLRDSEVKNILKQIEEKTTKPKPKIIFEKGETVRVKEGPFTNFNGTIEEINPAKGKLKVTVSIFGRPTPVELEYWQVEKV
jgi:transcriptional antiterminator NusG